MGVGRRKRKRRAGLRRAPVSVAAARAAWLARVAELEALGVSRGAAESIARAEAFVAAREARRRAAGGGMDSRFRGNGESRGRLDRGALEPGPAGTASARAKERRRAAAG